MRLPLALIVLSLAMGVLAGLFYLSSVPRAVDPAVVAQLGDLPARFARDHEPSLTFSLSELPQWKSDPILVDTARSHIDSQQYCQPGLSVEQMAARKGQTWQDRSLCGGLQSLPGDFFREPPYLHLSGHSYVMLALTSEPEFFGDVTWLTRHKPYLHVSELDEVALLGVELSAVERQVSLLEKEQVGELAGETSLLITKSEALVRLTSGSQPACGCASYGAFPLETWQGFLEVRGLTSASFREGLSCLSVVGSACITANLQPMQGRVEKAAVLSAGALTLLAATVILVFFRRSRERRKEQEARLFVLQTLSHEVRTPATTLTLSLEPIRRHFDDLPDEVQPAFLRICDNVQRLQRVVEASTQYLRGQLGGREIQFNKVHVASVSAFVQGLLDGYDQEIRVVTVQDPGSARLDPYWLGVCIRNLIDNAIVHGEEPIAVSLSRQGSDLRVTVQDQGKGPAFDLEQMTTPFSRGEGSRGLGFGLAVVRRLAEVMDGELGFCPAPTRFSITLRGVLVGANDEENLAG